MTDLSLKLVIAGSRTLCEQQHLSWVHKEISRYYKRIEATSKYDEFVIVHGGAKGIDSFAQKWCDAVDSGRQHTYGTLNVSCSIFKPQYDLFPPKQAPIIRNQEMALYGDVLLAFWDFKSNGTRNMIYNMLRQGKETHVYRWK